MDRYLSAAEVAARFAVSRSWVYKHKRALGGVQVGARMWRFPESGLQAYLYININAARVQPTHHARPPAVQRRREWRLDY